MDIRQITDLLPQGSLFRDHLQILDCVDSTNTRLKKLAEDGAAEGTVLLAEEQTAGRGTQGRSFYSARGEGLYLSLLLRPNVPLSDLLTLTGRTAVAVRDGIQSACGAPAAIKWLNDIYLNGRKLCGILTELGRGYVVVGIGVNVSQTPDSFDAQGLKSTATSLAAEGYPVSRHELAAAILASMEEMYRAFPDKLEDYRTRYQIHCLTAGRRISFQWEGRFLTGTALGIDQDFALLAEDSFGIHRTISSGTVTLL